MQHKLLAMNIQNGTDLLNGSPSPITKFRNLKLSPDSVSVVALGAEEKLQPVLQQQQQLPEYYGTIASPCLIRSSSAGTTPNKEKHTGSTRSKPPIRPRSSTTTTGNGQQQQQRCRRSSYQLPPVPKFEPKIPPPNPIQLRPRSVSESEVSSSTRRAIFGNYWGTNNPAAVAEESSPGGCHHFLTSKNNSNFILPETPPPPANFIRKRCSSLTIIDSMGMIQEPIDYRMFAPPKDHAAHSSICGRFASVEEVTPSPLMDSLPPLPSPLQRLCALGDSPGFLHGMYPLMTPIPVLRQSSYRSLFQKKGYGDSKSGRCSWLGSEDGQGSTSTAASTTTTFNLTSSWRRPLHAVSFDAASSSSSSSDGGSGHAAVKTGVRFDPRITVTEFDDPVERCWYSNEELECLKYETVLLAQEYLLTHPDAAERYNRATLDPVTGTFRRKALFSLPVLSTTEDEDILPLQDLKEYEALVKSQVNTILIVDPNKAILDLFCKSMHSMFPSARLFKTQSGDEALQLVVTNLQQVGTTGTSRCFDIIIVEQRLLQPPQTADHSRSRSLLSLTTQRSGAITPILEMHKPSSFSDPGQFTDMAAGICGSDLLKVIHRLEEKARAETISDSSSSAAAAVPSGKNSELSLCSTPIHRRSLLIGVSMHPDRDAKDFQLAGADIVWGKPIPCVGEALKRQLLHTLVNKRRPYLTGGKPQMEVEEEETT